MTDSDKDLERARYDARARAELLRNATTAQLKLGSQQMPQYLRAAYEMYEARITELLRPGQRVLELGSGAGMHTLVLLQTGADVVASDISSESLVLLKAKFDGFGGQLQTQVADMEKTPFPSASFDAVVSAGSLSYGEPALVDAEVGRLLRPGGMLICVDSLNHHPIYRFNRWLHHVRGDRSVSTLRRMPNLTRIQSLSQGFAQVELGFFGALSYLMPLMTRITGENTARAVSDRFDRFVGVRRAAFKFVLVARDRRPAAGNT
jgi:SAM-dependent methyltransferase